MCHISHDSFSLNVDKMRRANTDVYGLFFEWETNFFLSIFKANSGFKIYQLCKKEMSKIETILRTKAYPPFWRVLSFLQWFLSLRILKINWYGKWFFSAKVYVLITQSQSKAKKVWSSEIPIFFQNPLWNYIDFLSYLDMPQMLHCIRFRGQQIFLIMALIAERSASV